MAKTSGDHGLPAGKGAPTKPLVLHVSKKSVDMLKSLTELIDAATEVRKQIEGRTPHQKFSLKIEIVDEGNVAHSAHYCGQNGHHHIIIFDCNNGD